MDREIKFKAWDTVNNKMLYPDTTDWNELHILLNGETQSAQQSGYYQTTSVYNTDSFILLQFTGRKDSTGKEIYEGDIIKHGESIRTIEFKGCNWHAIRTDRTETILLSFCESPMIIGHIYENPELLNGATEGD